ncbi:hypothetical protein HYDPIDRAFT_92764, partial [Hydnomerulius pinastri MD-312]
MIFWVNQLTESCTKWVRYQCRLQGYDHTDLRHVTIGDSLSESDKQTLRAFAFMHRCRLTQEGFSMLPFAFPDANVQSLSTTISRVAFLSGVVPIDYDCCPNSCCCFVGPNEDLDSCPYCHSPRFSPSGQPSKRFSYIPIIPRLIAMYGHTDMAKKMRYRADEHVHKPDTINDVFDSSTYRELLGERVIINGKELPHSHFHDPRDIALGLSTDGFAPFKRRKRT